MTVYLVFEDMGPLAIGNDDLYGVFGTRANADAFIAKWELRDKSLTLRVVEYTVDEPEA